MRQGLEALTQAGVPVRQPRSPRSICCGASCFHRRCETASIAFLFIDSDIGFDPGDAMRLLARPEPVVAGVYMKKTGRDYSGVFAKGVDRVVFGPAAPAFYPMMYASAGFLRIKAGVLRQMIEELKLPRMSFWLNQGHLSFLPSSVRPRRTRRGPLLDRRLQLFTPRASDRNHSHGGHVDPARSLWKIWIHL